MSLVRSRVYACTVIFSLAAMIWAASERSFGFQRRQEASRFDALGIADPSAKASPSGVPLERLPEAASLRSGWSGFRAAHGASWEIHLDARSGAPVLAKGPGIPWLAGSGNGLHGTGPVTLESLEASLRAFIGRHRAVLLARDEELVLDRAASGQPTPEIRQVVFDRAVGGIPVTGDRYVFQIGHGNLIAFGATRWGTIAGGSGPSIDVHDALARLESYMGMRTDAGALAASAAEPVEIVDPGTLTYVPRLAAGTELEPYKGPIGAGYASALAWRFALRVAGEPGTWVGMVDAHSGAILALYDDNRYAQVKGGVYPVSNDQICPDGCEQSNYPMPYADVTINGSPSTTNSLGLFTCSPAGGTATTALAGPYVRVNDTCGAVSQSITCNGDLDLRSGSGTDCAVPPGASPGDTHASRTGFYHLNRIIEKARAWLPGNTWLTQQLTDNVNLNNTCNAFWDGTSVNFYKSGGGCRNTGELAGVFLHEWGHGLDDNDGGGSESPGEAYADITALLQTHVSCLGRGFHQSGNCGGYGNTCLDCSGIREADWDMKTRHTPSTAQNIALDCGPGTQFGPCGLETHCEGQIPVEAFWDLAARDLPSAGYDANSSWQIADKLWYQSRLGSGGDAYECAGVVTTGCLSTSWFMKFLTIDDDDGNLANGTPHAAAIFAAFNRHGLACGAATDASNQSGSSCPSIGTPTLNASAGTGSAVLSWTAVPSAASYNVLRNDAGCSSGYTIIARVTGGTTYTDPGLADGYTEFYAVQAVGSNSACLGSLSNCAGVTPQPFAGTVGLDQSVYSCSGTLRITVLDGNIGAATTTVTVSSTTETAPQTVTLAQSPPGSAQYTGTISATSAPPAADGLLSLADGDTITVRYIDADDGQGHTNTPRLATAAADCAPPVITNVRALSVTGQEAVIAWTTNEAADSLVRYGITSPASSASAPGLGTSHAVSLSGLAQCTTYRYRVQSTDKAGNTATSDNGGNDFTFLTLQNTQRSYASTDTPISIPDALPTGATSTITVTDGGTVADVNVKVNITHTYDGDLVLSLIAPDGTSITLSDGEGGDGDNYRNTVFDDEAATPIAAGSAPFTGSFRPETPLSAADGISAAGGWQLKAVDTAAQDAGTIDNWTLILTYPPAACGASLAYASSSVTESCAGSGTGGGNGVVDPGEDVVLPVTLRNNGTIPVTAITATLSTPTPGVTVTRPAAAYAAIPVGGSASSQAPHFAFTVGTGVPCGTRIDFHIQVNASEGSWSDTFSVPVGVGATPATYTSPNVPRPIPDQMTATSTLTVSDPSTIRDVDVGLSITHTADTDLDIFLIGPNGTRVELSTDNGGSGDNYTNTIFDDEAAMSITEGSPPFTGRFRPEGMLSTLDGIPANGTWTLEVTDDEMLDLGVLTAWSITLATGPEFLCNACTLTAPSGSPQMQRWNAGSKTGMQWESIPGASFYNVYRGSGPDLPNLLSGAVDSCRRMTSAGPATTSAVSETPAPGALLWYLVRAANAAGEGPAGNATAGPRIQNSSGDCP